ncbi:LOW QUALITY PROTEIN: hypothetical protein Smp_034030 [Schistosoma mansoni]|uniref:hypothetical protein n=1 Tax=Schistosoma mansoni TaxID=6183 RepID=UPI00022DC1D8|nr:LOW QUALITY PROTEIN: hypothetical protein Smp_034030 [Schistosoma mansoni]|eukprot:XP_018648218.1 LOW QUALITY PROTEIN: hypothetical protein Smp_034030 [Schistosoma mansoni]
MAVINIEKIFLVCVIKPIYTEFISTNYIMFFLKKGTNFIIYIFILMLLIHKSMLSCTLFVLFNYITSIAFYFSIYYYQTRLLSTFLTLLFSYFFIIIEYHELSHFLTLCSLCFRFRVPFFAATSLY